MTFRCVTRACGVSLLVSCGLPTVAFAQPRPEDGRAAMEAYERGNTAMDARQYAVAVREFEESCRLGCAPVARYNLGLAHRAQGHARAALENFERYLREARNVPEQRQSAVREAVRELGLRLATLRLTVVSPATFTLSVDGQSAALIDGRVMLDPGDHDLAVTAVGYLAWNERARLQPGQSIDRSVELTREPPTAVTPPPSVAQPAGPPTAGTSPVATNPVALNATPHPASDRSHRPSTSIASRWWFWTGVAVLAAGLSVGTYFLVDAVSPVESPLTGTDVDVQTLRLR